MKKIVCVVFVLAVITAAGCVSQPVPTPTPVAEPTATPTPTLQPTPSPTPTPTPTDYELFEGNWVSEDSLGTRISVLENGGKAIQFLFIYGKQIAGNIVCVSDSENHETVQVSFQGEADNGQFTYEFTDDGYGNSGKLTIVFLEGCLEVTIESSPAPVASPETSPETSPDASASPSQQNSAEPSGETTPAWGIGNGKFIFYPELID